jgi:hypothetical protein
MIASPGSGLPSASDASGATPAPADNRVSLWDFILNRQYADLRRYLERLAAADARDGTSLVAVVLDKRVEQSVRFKFHNPVLGTHGVHLICNPSLPWPLFNRQ